MRSLSRLVAVAALAVGVAAPAATASSVEIVTVTFNPMVVCVTYPCHQPPPVTVCVNVPRDAPTCTPR